MTAVAGAPTIEPEALGALIREVRSEYLELGATLYDIGNGECETFAGKVLTRAFGEGWPLLEDAGDWGTVWSDQFFAPPPGSDVTFGATSWDWGLLSRHWGIEMPEADRARHDAIVADEPSHCWIVLRGRHYDCEHPDGVASFFELDFFRRWLAPETEII